jgi:hypothetical protein
MKNSLYIREITVGEEGNRVTLGLEDVKKIEVDLEKGTAQATLSNDTIIPITPAEAVLFVHYNGIWRPL